MWKNGIFPGRKQGLFQVVPDTSEHSYFTLFLTKFTPSNLKKQQKSKKTIFRQISNSSLILYSRQFVTCYLLSSNFITWFLLLILSHILKIKIIGLIMQELFALFSFCSQPSFQNRNLDKAHAKNFN